MAGSPFFCMQGRTRMIRFFKKGLRFLKRQWQVIRDFTVFQKEKNSFSDGEVCVLFSHNLDGGGGAPVVLFELAKLLKSENRKVLILAGKGGALVNAGRAAGLPAFRMGFLHKKYIQSLDSVKIKMILVNTIVCHQYISEIEKYISEKVLIIWWIHEEDRLIQKYGPQIPAKLAGNVHVACVSERVKKCLSEIRPDISSEILYYGCYDQLKNNSRELRKKNHAANRSFQVSVIGRICGRKNQIQVVRAYKLLPEEIRENIKIHLIAASWEEEYKSKLLAEIGKNENIQITGPVQRSEMYRVYFESDVIVCSSTDDPLPVVITEAMMYGCSFITSSCTGQASLITNGTNGFVYRAEDTNELKDRIEYCYKNRDDDELRKNARKLFENTFSLEHLSQQVMRLTER